MPLELLRREKITTKELCDSVENKRLLNNIIHIFHSYFNQLEDYVKRKQHELPQYLLSS
jgi:hypothetical protein